MMHTRFFRFVSAVCCGTLIALPVQSGYASSAAPDPATTLANSLRALQDGENTAPRDHWDPKYVEAQLGNDPARTFAWVREHTYWIPYHGILRGPVGVLMDRQGDSLDRALLLATMLKDEGQTVRLAHGTIAAASAGPILVDAARARAAGLVRVAVPRKGGQADPSAILATKYQFDPAAIRQTLQTQARAATDKNTTLGSRLGDQGRRLIAAVGQSADAGAVAAIDAALAAVQDHWWAQTRQGSGWRDWDLVNASTGPADRTVDPANLPDDLYQQVTLRVVAEKCQGDATSETVVLEHAWHPAATIGQPISLTFASSGWPKPFPYAGLTVDQSLRKFAAAQTEWTPVLSIGKDQTQQSAITASGTLTMSTNGNDALAVARNATRGLGAAIDDVFGSSPAAPAAGAQPAQLSAVWLEYQIDGPGLPTQKIRRDVFDLLGPAARAARRSVQIDDGAILNRGLAMMMSTDILPMVSELSPQYVNHLAAQSLIANRALLNDAIANRVGDDFAAAQDVSKKVAPGPDDLYSLALTRFAFGQTTGQVYVDRPNILTRHQVFRVKGEKLVPLVATDIVSAGVGVAPFAPSPYAIRLLQGVFDTNAEAVMQSARPVDGSLAWAYDGARNWITLTSATDPKLASLTLSADVRQRITNALASGHVVVAPQGPVAMAGGRFSGWWQIDRQTGETLGMGESGWGQSLPEYALIIYVAASEGFMFGFLLCVITGGSHCIRQGLINGAIAGVTAGVGLGFAGALGLSTGGEGILTGLAGEEGSLGSAAGEVGGEAGAAGGEAGAGAGGTGGIGGGAAGEGAGPAGAGGGDAPTPAQQAAAFRKYAGQGHAFDPGRWPELDEWLNNPNATAADFPKTGGPTFEQGPGGEWELRDPPVPPNPNPISPKAYDPLEPEPPTSTPTSPPATTGTGGSTSPLATTVGGGGGSTTVPMGGSPTVPGEAAGGGSTSPLATTVPPGGNTTSPLATTISPGGTGGGGTVPMGGSPTVPGEAAGGGSISPLATTGGGGGSTTVPMGNSPTVPGGGLNGGASTPGSQTIPMGNSPTIPGCALPCTPGGATTLVGLGGAIGALGGS